MRLRLPAIIAGFAAITAASTRAQFISPEQLGASEVVIGEPGVAWYTTWETAFDEAERSGRPIFLMFAATQCHGVPGIF